MDKLLTMRLRESVELETRSDLFAAASNLHEATILMREANKIRASVFGKLDPNELRERTHEALLGEPVPLTKALEREMRNLTANTTIDKENDRIVGLLPDGSDECAIHGVRNILPGVCPFCDEEARATQGSAPDAK